MKPKICVMRIEGTNCEDETARAFRLVGADAEIVHLKQLIGDCSEERKRDLFDYDAMIFPGGFSAGDYVRAGAIWSARIQSKLKNKLNSFVKEGRVVGGICNGFQVLTTLDMLPGNVRAALSTNESAKFECRFVYLKPFGKSAITENLDHNEILSFPVAHMEGNLTFVPGKEDESLKALKENDQIIFRYVYPDGTPANRKYPINPNGSIDDIAGVSNLEGNVFGLMPHPERVLDSFNHFDWTRNPRKVGDGLITFKSLIEFIKKKL